ncbi:hypothetical protein CCYA_CCYA12G3425 [Cyanidiococcus yangmingshanensis]|nr:hypothetical protein CCYA_CCYA12G3425 [Cyanidiococcus yangmingshanensis]
MRFWRVSGATNVTFRHPSWCCSLWSTRLKRFDLTRGERSRALIGEKQRTCANWTSAEAAVHSPDSEAGKKASVWLWGNADDGRLGLALNRLEPDRDFGSGRRCVRPSALEPWPATVKQVALGAAHSIVLLDNGEAFSFGLGSDGQLGLPPEALVTHPSQPPFVRSWLQHWTLDRWPWRWLRWARWTPQPVRWSQPQPRLVQVAAGAAHSVWISAQGHVYTCGRGTHGQLGHVSSGTGFSTRGGGEAVRVARSIMRPLRVEALARANIRAVQAACGDNFTLILADDGSVYGCGAIENGQLGLGDPDGVEQVQTGPGGQRLISTFRRLRALRGEPVAQLFAGFQAAAAILRNSGQLVIWGKVSDRIYLEPTPIPSLPGRIHKVAFGFNHILALVESASDRRRAIYSWGSNENGCLGFGYGSRGAYAVHSPQRIESFPGSQATSCITDIAAGYRTSYALRQDVQTGRAYLYSWGSGLCGALGLGDRLIPEAGAGTVDMWEPVCVFDTDAAATGNAGPKAFRIVSGFQHVAMYTTSLGRTDEPPESTT